MVTTYSNESEVRNPLQMARALGSDVVNSLQLARRLLLRDLSVQYRQTFFGYFWAFAPPLAMAGAFTLAAKSGAVSFGATAIAYPAYVIIGMCLWQTFHEALHGPLDALAKARDILTRIHFAREALFLAKFLEVLVNFSVKLVLILVVLRIYSIAPGSSLLLAFVGIVGLVALGLLIGLLIAPVGLLFDDVGRSVLALSGFWLMLTPVLFPIPESGPFRVAVLVNPVTPLLVTSREALTGSPLTQLPQFFLVAAVCVLGLPLALLGVRLAMPFVVERFSA
jgi:lipopolysaccharide transport system permease protein